MRNSKEESKASFKSFYEKETADENETQVLHLSKSPVKEKDVPKEDSSEGE